MSEPAASATFAAAGAAARYGLVVVGASWGGLNALSRLASALPADFAVPVAFVQHRSKESDHVLAQLLQQHTGLRVKEVEDKEPIAPGHIYVAPPDYHMLVDMLEDGPQFALSVDPPVRYSRPSIDVTFVSAADAFGRRVAGVVLTGANEDGAAGLRRVVDRGGHAIVQEPNTAEIQTMPQAALRAVPTAEVLPLDAIGPRLVSLGGRRAAGSEGGITDARATARREPLPPLTTSPLRRGGGGAADSRGRL